MGAHLIISTVIVMSFGRHWSPPLLGLANLVTLLRAALASLLSVPIVFPPDSASSTSWLLAGGAAIALALDGVDGMLARRTGLATAFGARFDMEVDAVFAALLSIAILRMQEAGPWILLLGLMRYLFVLASWPLPWLAAPLTQRRRRKAVCVIQIATLVALLSPLVQPPLSGILGAVATLLLAWSFGTDIRELASGRSRAWER